MINSQFQGPTNYNIGIRKKSTIAERTCQRQSERQHSPGLL